MRFPSPTAFAAYLATRLPAMEAAQLRGAQEAGHDLQHAAQEKLGHYQAASGPFPGWAELSDTTKEQRKRLGFTENDPLLRTGQLRDAIAYTAEVQHVTIGIAPATVGDGTAANPTRDIGVVALAMEMGTNRVPPRPFIGPAMFEGGHAAADKVVGHIMGALAGQSGPLKG